MTRCKAKEKLDHIILVEGWHRALDHHKKLVKAADKRGGDAAVAELGKMVDFERWKERWELYKEMNGLFASVTNQAYQVNGDDVWFSERQGPIHWLHPTVDRIDNRKTYTFENMHFPTVETQLRRGVLSQEELADEIKQRLRRRAKAV